MGFETNGISDKTSFTFTTEGNIDTEKPVISNINLTSNNGGGYSVSISSPSDDVESIEYRIYKDEVIYTDWSEYTSEFEITQTGSYKIQAKAINKAGNTSDIVEKTFSVTKGQPNGNGGYVITPHEDTGYTVERTDDGRTEIIVNSEGFKTFTVDIEKAIGHEGNEVILFVHMRNGVQIGMNATSADFEIVNRAKAGFNVQVEDTIKIFIVDDISNDMNHNPTIL